MANGKCKKCGCVCDKCIVKDQDLQLHVEIENLKQRLVEKENHIIMMETNFLNETNKFPNGELGMLKEELLTWQDKYKRLYEAHRRVQRVNQGLEDKLLKLVDVCETEKNTLTKDVEILAQNLAEANYTIKKLTSDNERYKNDVSLAIQFLHCKQTNYIGHRFDSLPIEVQTQVANYMNNKRKPIEEKKVSLEPKSIKVPIPTFPPTAMVYSVPKSPKSDNRINDNELESSEADIVSAAIMAKVLEERQKERAFIKHCDTCMCAKTPKIIYDVSHHSIGTQTGDSTKSAVCLKCNEILKQTQSNIQIVKAADEPIKIQTPYPVLPVPLSLETTQNLQNVVKVQPNNFLIENEISSTSKCINTSTFRNEHINNDTGSDLISFQDVIHKENEKFDVGVTRHERNDGLEKGEKLSDADGALANKKDLKQRNILLDNAAIDPAGGVTPVLFAKTHRSNLSQTITQQFHNNEAVSVKYQQQEELASVSSSQNSKQLSLVSENSTQHQQRISDWVQITIENDNISSTTSPETSSRVDVVDDLMMKNKVIRFNGKDNGHHGGSSGTGARYHGLDVSRLRNNSAGKEKNYNKAAARYAEIEENVKRFLFGESEFLKTVEIGKWKYRNYYENDNSLKESSIESRTTSHTETEI